MRNAQYEAGQHASQFLPPGYRVEAYSGQREGGNGGPHSYAAAIDWRIIGPDGQLANYQDPAHYGAYQAFHQDIHKYLSENHPELAKQHRWGGGFGGQLGKNPATGKDYVYGAMDTMHGDFAGGEGRMAAFTWSGGYKGNQPWGKLKTTGGMGNVKDYQYGGGWRNLGMTPGAPRTASTDPTAGAIPGKYSGVPASQGSGERSAGSDNPDDPKKPDIPDDAHMAGSTADMEHANRIRAQLSKPIRTRINAELPRAHQRESRPVTRRDRTAVMSICSVGTRWRTMVRTDG